jgi:outer membrane receptor for ferrienterochelin and colicins
VAGDILGNADLKPQHIHTFEGNIALEPVEWLRATTSLSYSYVLDKAEFVSFGVNNVARNLARLGVLAWQTEARLRWEERLYGYLNVTYVSGRRDLGESGYRAQLVGSHLEIYPPLILNAGLGYRLRQIPLRFTAESRFLSRRRASDSNIVENGAVYHIPAAFYLDGSVALVDMNLLEDRSTTLSFVVRNALDNRAAHPGFSGIDYPSAPRMFLIQWQQEL